MTYLPRKKPLDFAKSVVTEGLIIMSIDGAFKYQAHRDYRTVSDR